MHGGTARFFEGNAGRVSFSLSPYAAVVSLVCLLWGLFSNTEASVNIEYGFSLLAALGAAGCLGHLAAYAYRNSGHLSSTCSVLGGARSLAVRRSGDILVERADWPLLVALLFGPFFVLLAGLGGWV